HAAVHDGEGLDVDPVDLLVEDAVLVPVVVRRDVAQVARQALDPEVAGLDHVAVRVGEVLDHPDSLACGLVGSQSFDPIERPRQGAPWRAHGRATRPGARLRSSGTASSRWTTSGRGPRSSWSSATASPRPAIARSSPATRTPSGSSSGGAGSFPASSTRTTTSRSRRSTRSGQT